MAKKRSRESCREVASTKSTPTKQEPAYWRGRLFRNSFTYGGERRLVRGWAVRIQHRGQRKTFSLESANLARAAAQACRIYLTVRRAGWESAGDQWRGGISASGRQVRAPGSSPAHWEARLTRRRYPESRDGRVSRELSVRLEHEGHGNYFPLGTTDVKVGALRTVEIHQELKKEGWSAIRARYGRELTLGLHWLDNPVAWTYTTLHTRPGVVPNARLGGRGGAARVTVAVIEPDAALGAGLAECIDQQMGFQCQDTYGGEREALQGLARAPVDLVMANQEEAGATGLNALARLEKRPVGLLYSVYEDSEHLFEATPGGAVGYLLKRTPPFRLLEPIASPAVPLTREFMINRIQDYFLRVLVSTPGVEPPAMARLTPRERDILASLAKGALAKEIAGTLGISVWTVHGHVKNILEKLKVRTRTQAVVQFLQK
jgi:DNA-binding NarL/FixJ family response regulator